VASRIAKANNALLLAIIIVNGYIVAAPLLPALLFHLQNYDQKYKQLSLAIQPKSSPRTTRKKPQPNHLIIPNMLLDQPIYDGPVSQEYKILNEGIWRYSNGSSPDRGSNTVLIGHRFTYTDPRGVFYYLNRLGLGDSIGLWWNNKEYVYNVSAIHEVPSHDVAIENPSTKPELTLFTCTPLWLPRDRLVVTAGLETIND
jgi:LPXTG-site transpeptidase (sortase) family protein